MFQSELTEFFAELTEFAAELSEFSIPLDVFFVSGTGLDLFLRSEKSSKKSCFDGGSVRFVLPWFFGSIFAVFSCVLQHAWDYQHTHTE